MLLSLGFVESKPAIGLRQSDASIKYIFPLRIAFSSRILHRFIGLGLKRPYRCFVKLWLI